MLFRTSEKNEAEITILSARDTTRAWASGQGIMGRDVVVYRTGHNTWLSSTEPTPFFRFVLFHFSLFSSSLTMYPVW